MFDSCLSQDVVSFLNDFHEAMSLCRQKKKKGGGRLYEKHQLSSHHSFSDINP